VNIYALVILWALIADWALNLVADLLNLRALRPELPGEFRDAYDADSYRRSQLYTRTRTWFDIIPTTFNLIVLIAFWFLGGFATLDGWLRGFGLAPMWTGLAFIGALALGHGALNLPFRLYSTFVIEERFGFNRTTWRTFWIDLVKALVLGIVVGAPVLAAILLLFERAGPLAWLYCWIATSMFSLALQFVAPTWIMPLFNTFTPLDTGELREAILTYARSVRFPLQGIFVLDGSRRSSKANAFFTGFGSRKRIALFDTLIANHGTTELVSVVAHEIGHYKKHHIVKRLALAIAHTGVLFALLQVVLSREGLFLAFGVQEPSVYAGLVFFGLLYTPVELGLSFWLQASSRRDEYQADRFAAETVGESEPLVAALKRLSLDSLSNLTPHPFYVALHYSHPPVMQRIAALRGMG
jgi:STE24 endopeptidase